MGILAYLLIVGGNLLAALKYAISRAFSGNLRLKSVPVSTRGPIDFKVSAGGIKFLKYMVLLDTSI